MQGSNIELIPADLSLADQAADYYNRNREFLERFEPRRSEEFFSLEYQRELCLLYTSDVYKRQASCTATASSHHPAGLTGSTASSAGRS